MLLNDTLCAKAVFPNPGNGGGGWKLPSSITKHDEEISVYWIIH